MPTVIRTALKFGISAAKMPVKSWQLVSIVLKRLIIFVRYPEPGTAKTRLIPALGAAGAAALYRQMAEHTLVQVRRLQAQRPVDVEICYTGGNLEQMQQWLGADLKYSLQAEGDLGDRMARSLQAAFDAGVKRAVIIGTDCPELDDSVLENAFAELILHDLVLGRAADGGYYLIGLRRFVADLFAGISWSTAEVLQQTVRMAESLDLVIAFLPTLADVDYPADLEIWRRVNQRLSLETNDTL